MVSTWRFSKSVQKAILEMETFPVRQKDLDDGVERAKASHPNSIGCGLYHAERIYISLVASEWARLLDIPLRQMYPSET